MTNRTPTVPAPAPAVTMVDPERLRRVIAGAVAQCPAWCDYTAEVHAHEDDVVNIVHCFGEEDYGLSLAGGGSVDACLWQEHGESGPSVRLDVQRPGELTAVRMTVDEARQVASRITKMCDIAEQAPAPGQVA